MSEQFSRRPLAAPCNELATGETALLDEAGVVVTATRLVLPGGHTVSIRAVASVAPGRTSRAPELGLIGGGLLLFVGSCGIAPLVGGGMAGLVAAATLFALSVLAIAASFLARPVPCLRLTTTAGPFLVLAGRDGALIRRVADAVDRAMAARD